MAKYELSKEQVQALRNILANVQIAGREAPVILELSQALMTPIPENKEKE